MGRNSLIQAALDSAWHRQTAAASMARWLQLCEQEQWGDIPEDIVQLTRVFGASWYFTRYIFYHGRHSAKMIDVPRLESFENDSLFRFLSPALQGGGEDAQFARLRDLKNEAMLQILLRRLSGVHSLQENETALTRLAVATLTIALEIVGLKLTSHDCRIAVLGMGRIAGFEMNYGSDLDLIFLYEDSSAAFHAGFSAKVRLLLRYMPLLTANGMLYDIDMRLRPHGTAGVLITSLTSFLAYHQGEREIWERQMMTRCRPVIDYQGLGQHTLQQIFPHIYRRSWGASLATEILSSKQRVRDELANHRGKYDVKRGHGGIMDIDFLCHYLQLRHGYRYPELQTSSTRAALTKLADCGLLLAETASGLLDAYDFFKQIEGCLRLFDMKPENTFASTLTDDNALVRAMAYRDERAADHFLADYRQLIEMVHSLFIGVLNGEHRQEQPVVRRSR